MGACILVQFGLDTRTDLLPAAVCIAFVELSFEPAAFEFVCTRDCLMGFVPILFLSFACSCFF